MIFQRPIRFQKFFGFLFIIGTALLLMLIMDVLVLAFMEDSSYRELSVVYTWVNGSDPEYIKQRTAYPPTVNDTSIQINAGQNRWRDNNELRFSLRSVHKYAPWIKNIFIVINDNTKPPIWLDTTNPHVHIVYVSEMLSDPKAFPVFNSNALELNLHNIKGLTDPFIYMNDDFYFMQSIKPSLFVTKKGHPKFFWTNEVSPTKKDLLTIPTQFQSHFLRTNELLDKSFGYHERKISAHAPYVYSKKAWNEIDQHYGPLLNSTLAHRYRQGDDINSHHLHHYYIIHTTSQARFAHLPFEPVPSQIPLDDPSLGENVDGDSVDEENVDSYEFEAVPIPAKKSKLGYFNYPLWWTWLNVEFVRGGFDFFIPAIYKIWRPVVMCINDDYQHSSNPEASRKQIQQFLLDNFPETSPFELPDVPVKFV